jgi:hypothetical protein
MLLAAMSILVLVVLASVWVGRWRQSHTLAAQRERLMQVAASVSLEGGFDFEALPAPVARYLRWSLPQAPSIRLVRIGQVGSLRTDVRSDRWMHFQAEHLVAPGAGGFLWNARVTVAPLLHVRVRDAFIDGQGSGHVSLLSAFPVSAAAGTPKLNSGALHRFLAEAVWYPTALLPSSKLQWTPIDAGSALATLTVHGVSVSLEFRFADTAEVTGIYTPARWGTFNGGYEQRPWEGHFRNYERRDGMWVPREGDVGWYLGGEWQPVWTGAVVSYEID